GREGLHGILSRGQVGPPWFSWRRRPSKNKQQGQQRATIKALPTSTQPPSPLQYDEPLHYNEQKAGRGQAPPLQYNDDTDSSNVGAPLAGALGVGMAPFEMRMDSLASQLIDPLNGLADLQARRLKVVDNQVFRHDPLRMLRAVRIMMRYQLQID